MLVIRWSFPASFAPLMAGSPSNPTLLPPKSSATEPLGKTPLALDLPIGPQSLIARSPGLSDSALFAMIGPEPATTNILFAYGTLSVRTVPPGATLTWAGQTLTTPVVIRPAKPGQTEVLIHPADSGLTPTNVVVNISTGRDTVIDLAFVRPSGRTFPDQNGIEFVWVPGLPGSVEGAWVGKFEVTQPQFEIVMGVNPSEIKDPRLPVTRVSFLDTVKFCNLLTRNSTGHLRYAVPTEQQWEFLVADARIEDSITSRGMDRKRTQPEPVGSGKPNRLGLYDVRGNVWEWCKGAARRRVRWSFRDRPLCHPRGRFPKTDGPAVHSESNRISLHRPVACTDKRREELSRCRHDRHRETFGPDFRAGSLRCRSVL
jgi:hypothetical protein